MYKLVRVWPIMICLFLLGSLTLAQANSSHQVTITIEEVCRYRIENTALKPSEGNRVIQEVSIGILSNSQRQWRFIAIPEQDGTAVEWSVDGQTWHGFNNNGSTILYGTKAFWNNYRVFYRLRRAESGVIEPIAIRYQLLYDC